MCEAAVEPPGSRMFVTNSNVWLRIRNTAIVSPSTRPRPSMLPPMIPPLPNGRITVRTIPHLVLPSANAASHSVRGAWLNTSRTIAVTIGRTMNDTTSPALNIEPRNVCDVGRKMGMKSR